jgi:hypothetical protein
MMCYLRVLREACPEPVERQPIRTAEYRTRNFEYRSDSLIILRFLVLLFDLPAIGFASGEAGGYSEQTLVWITTKNTKRF